MALGEYNNPQPAPVPGAAWAPPAPRPAATAVLIGGLLASYVAAQGTVQSEVAQAAANEERKAAKEEFWDTGEVKSKPYINTMSGDEIPIHKPVKPDDAA